MSSHSNSNLLPADAYFIVGGAVRDRLLNLKSKDLDWVVVGLTPEQMLEQGFQQVGADFPVFIHPISKQEYALARTERKHGEGYKGFICDFSPEVTLEQDLERRDLTINAMAEDAYGNVIDPYNGQQDLEQKTLRHVSSAFAEAPLRVLRVARFAARFYPLGFSVAPETITLMSQISGSGELETLTPERVWQETQRALAEDSPHIYFEVLRQCNALKIVMPELDALFGIPQPAKHHPEIDCGIHALMSLQASTHLTHSTDVRFAALVHDLGKAKTDSKQWPKHHGHEQLGLKPIKQLCRKLRTNRYAESLSLIASQYHTHIHRAFELKPSTILKVLSACDAFRKPQQLEDLLLVCISDSRGRLGFESIAYPQADYFRSALAAATSIKSQPFLEQGYKGKELGGMIEKARIEAISLVEKPDI